MKSATQMIDSNRIEYTDNKVYAKLAYEVMTENGLSDYHSVYRLISEDTSMPFDALLALVEAASLAFAAELEA